MAPGGPQWLSVEAAGGGSVEGQWRDCPARVQWQGASAATYHPWTCARKTLETTLRTNHGHGYFGTELARRARPVWQDMTVFSSPLETPYLLYFFFFDGPIYIRLLRYLLIQLLGPSQSPWQSGLAPVALFETLPNKLGFPRLESARINPLRIGAKTPSALKRRATRSSVEGLEEIEEAHDGA